MNLRAQLLYIRVPLSALLLAFCAIIIPAQQLHTLNPPTGSTIVYGQVADQTTEAGAMAAILRHVHQDIGERPQVGKLFQVRGTESVAVFFSATRHTGKQAQIGGIIIAIKVNSDHVEAALITNEASRFHSALPADMKSLFAIWHPLKDQAAAESLGGHGAPIAPLHRQVAADNSASVNIPESWKIFPQLSGGGTICAGGPNGETAFLGVTFLAEDTNNPMVQQTMHTLQMGGLRNTSYAQAAYVPYGADPKKAYVYLFNQSRGRGGMPPAEFNITTATPMPQTGAGHCTHMLGTVDFKDQKGPREMDATFCAYPPKPAGGWLSQVFVTTIPIPFAQKERPTLGAILQSFSVNQAVVNRETAQIAGPIINQIHAIGAAAAANADAAHKAEDIQNSSVYHHWDSMDRRSQEFENYQLGYSVISDNENTAHGTFWNEDADALVKSHPDRFEYVNAPGYWKGIDY